MPGLAQELKIEAKVDKTSITTDEDLIYKLIISSETLESLPDPEFPDFENFDVLSSAQTSQISLDRGKLKSLLVYVFILRPKEVGSLEIRPSKIVVNKKEYFSEQFNIEVTPGTREPSPQPRPPKEKEIPSESEQIIL